MSLRAFFGRKAAKTGLRLRLLLVLWPLVCIRKRKIELYSVCCCFLEVGSIERKRRRTRRTQEKGAAARNRD